MPQFLFRDPGGGDLPAMHVSVDGVDDLGELIRREGLQATG